MKFPKSSRRFWWPIIFLNVLFQVVVVFFTYRIMTDSRRTFDEEDRIKLILRGPLPPSDPQLVDIFRTRFLHEPSKKPYHLVDIAHDMTYGMYDKYSSFQFYKHVLKELFKHPLETNVEKFYIEAGAMDGQFQSNTLYLEQNLNFTGLLIEPHSGLFQALLQKHRKAWCARVCLSPNTFSYSATMRVISVPQPANVPQESSNRWTAMNSIVESEMDDRSAIGYTSFEDVQCFPIETILLAVNRTRVTVFSLDVEDVELDILQKFPFSSVFVDVWLVEHRRKEENGKEFSAVYDPSFVLWFEHHNYKLFGWDQTAIVDYVFVHRDSPYSDIEYSWNKEYKKKLLI